MKICGALVFLILLKEAVSQNKRNPKPNVRTPAQNQKGPSPGADAGQSLIAEQVPPAQDAVVSLLRSASQGLYPVPRSGEDMKLYFLRNTSVTCNDGTTAGYYLREAKGNRFWIVFLEGGWCCYNRETCDARYKNIPRLMSSSEWPQTKRGTGILSAQLDENPHWWNVNAVFVPYCSSDVWSGTLPKGRHEYAFMGSLIIREVIKDLIPKGIKQARAIMLAGTSAGGTGVLLNIDRLAALLVELEAEAVQVRGLVDSGWFLDLKPTRQSDCADSTSCTPTDAIKKGLRFWNGILPEKCKQQFKRGDEWNCFFGHKLYSSLKSPIFVVQWLFDEEQLRIENIQLGIQSLMENQWNHIRNLGREMRNSLRDVAAMFVPACLSHTLITKSNWMDFQVKSVSLPRALQCWEKSLQESTKTPKTLLRGCPFHLIDNCQLPHCNPTCPALHDHTTGQELNMMQILHRMGFDVQKKAQELMGMPRNGG